MGQKIYLDTNLYIYIFEKNDEFFDRTAKLLASSNTIAASPLLITELLISPLKQQDTKLIAAYSQLAQRMDNLTLVDFSTPIAIQSAVLRQKYNLNIADSIHLATAIYSECDKYYTNDQDLNKVKEIPVKLI